ncbi:sulfurtransferase TusA family protein [Euryarchaeota archaeon]|jgi:TusA-related sulfurtransferase|nr:sulfurtransferase TusA family protein [Euryarchaeota archaeon]MDC3310843.1 sulfurtransferase TusA family protein [Candidatus Poseidoniales archaeon]MDG1542595.1 sulfurtransferase TusA family protein [Candidatus Thalassarchaeaceae archaeon]|tara:strand:+ start:985 stop:1227 length:243 start_codon:yes stop_codon:yes gene_type:complete
MSESISEDKEIILDLIGFFCPIPIHETRKLLDNLDAGVIIQVLCDDPETKHDMPALCDRLGVELISLNENSGEFVYKIRK